MRLSAAALLLATILALAACAGPEPTPTGAPVLAPTATPVPDAAPTATATPTSSPASTPSGAPTATATPLPAPTPTPTATPALAPTATPSPTPTSLSVTLATVADVTLYGESGNLGNGAGEHLFSGFTNQGNERRALVRFDISSIPQGATITRVRLTFSVDRTQAGPLPFELHRVSTAWSEGIENAGGEEGRGASNPSGATWTRASLTTTWGAPGGDFEATSSGSANVSAPGTVVRWEGAGLVADVQAWLVSPSLNHGWLVKPDASSGTRTAKRFGSREGAPAGRPTLVVDYTLP
jgi:hypothetical protein